MFLDDIFLLSSNSGMTIPIFLQTQSMGKGSLSKLFFFFLIYFIYFWLCWVFVVARGFSLVAESRGYSSLRCVGFSLWWLLLLWSTGSRCVGFSSCGSRALLLHGTWDLPGPGLKPVSPELAGRFLTTVPPGKPCLNFFNLWSFC